MKIVIVGDGKVGSAVTDILSGEGHDITLIDRSRDVLHHALEEQDILVVHGNGAAIKVQKEACVNKSDLLIAVTSSDETNLLCCVLGRKLGCPHTIARIKNPEYTEQLFLLKDEFALSMVVNAYYAAASEIFRILQFPSFLQRDTFAKGRVEIVEIKLEDKNPLIGSKLKNLAHIVKARSLVCSVERGEEVIIPDGDFILQQGDRIFVTAPSAELAKLIKNLHLQKHKIQDVLIIGGSRTAYFLSQNLLMAGVKVKIIEKNNERCHELAQHLEKAQIINADGSSRWVLDSEGLPCADAVVTLTNIDEENILISKYADLNEVPVVITKLDRTEFKDLYDLMGIKCAVSPKWLIAEDIARYVRAMQNTKGDEVLALHRIGGMEALEFRAKNFSRAGDTLMAIPTKKDVLIASINRNGHIIIPGGSDTIENGDTVIVITTPNRKLNSLEDILSHAS